MHKSVSRGHSYIVEVECIDEIRHVFSSPRSNVVVEHVVAVCLGPLLNKHHVGCVVCVFRQDIATTSPRRHYVTRLAPACSTKRCQRSCITVEGIQSALTRTNWGIFAVVRVFHPFTRRAFFRHHRNNMVSPAALFYRLKLA